MIAAVNAPDSKAPRVWKWRLFQGFKYTIYVLLIINMVGFFVETLAASGHTFQNGVPVSEFINVFTGALDSGAWIILLLLFELETFVIQDDKLKGALKWSLHLGRALCYVVIAYALTGYISKTTVISDFEATEIANACDLVPQGFSMVEGIDDYTTLDANNCQDLADLELLLNPRMHLLSDKKTLGIMNRMVWTDIVNALVWILIVIVLELEVFLSSSRLFGSKIYVAYKLSKLLLYGTLFVTAIYWWAFGEFLDFWDAFLWLVAFFFIEMNVIQWQEETHEHMLEDA